MVHASRSSHARAIGGRACPRASSSPCGAVGSRVRAAATAAALPSLRTRASACRGTPLCAPRAPRGAIRAPPSANIHPSPPASHPRGRGRCRVPRAYAGGASAAHLCIWRGGVVARWGAPRRATRTRTRRTTHRVARCMRPTASAFVRRTFAPHAGAGAPLFRGRASAHMRPRRPCGTWRTFLKTSRSVEAAPARPPSSYCAAMSTPRETDAVGPCPPPPPPACCRLLRAQGARGHSSGGRPSEGAREQMSECLCCTWRGAAAGAGAAVFGGGGGREEGVCELCQRGRGRGRCVHRAPQATGAPLFPSHVLMSREAGASVGVTRCAGGTRANLVPWSGERHHAATGAATRAGTCGRARVHAAARGGARRGAARRGEREGRVEGARGRGGGAAGGGAGGEWPRAAPHVRGGVHRDGARAAAPRRAASPPAVGRHVCRGSAGSCGAPHLLTMALC